MSEKMGNDKIHSPPSDYQRKYWNKSTENAALRMEMAELQRIQEEACMKAVILEAQFVVLQQEYFKALWKFSGAQSAWDSFLCGIAKAAICRGILRASKGHKRVFGTNPNGGQEWSGYEIAKAFSMTNYTIHRLETATIEQTYAAAQAASATCPQVSKDVYYGRI